MKKILICVLLVLIAVNKDYSTSIDKIIIAKKPIISHFNLVYDSLRKHEGNYSNIPEDFGKETYGGITRKYNNDWYGWRYVELEKKEKGILPNNYKVENAELWVKDFYLTMWANQGFYRLNDANLAYALFDARVNHYTAPKLINRVLVDMGYSKLNINKEDWLKNWPQDIDSELFIQNLCKERIKLYHYLVRKNESQKIFLPGWLKRVSV